jgi:hypothetical protein
MALAWRWLEWTCSKSGTGGLDLRVCVCGLEKDMAQICFDGKSFAAFAAKFPEIVTIHTHNIACAMRHDCLHYTRTDATRIIMISYDYYGVHMVA